MATHMVHCLGNIRNRLHYYTLFSSIIKLVVCDKIKKICKND